MQPDGQHRNYTTLTDVTQEEKLEVMLGKTGICSFGAIMSRSEPAG